MGELARAQDQILRGLARSVPRLIPSKLRGSDDLSKALVGGTCTSCAARRTRVCGESARRHSTGSKALTNVGGTFLAPCPGKVNVIWGLGDPPRDLRHRVVARNAGGRCARRTRDSPQNSLPRAHHPCYTAGLGVVQRIGPLAHPVARCEPAVTWRARQKRAGTGHGTSRAYEVSQQQRLEAQRVSRCRSYLADPCCCGLYWRQSPRWVSPVTARFTSRTGGAGTR